MDRTVGEDWIDIGGGRRGFRGEDVNAGVPGTVVQSGWLNGVQEEIVTAIERAGLEPSSVDLQQLLRVIRYFGGEYVAVAGGTANAITATLDPAPATYAELVGTPIRPKILATNTGPATLNVNGLGDRDILTGAGAALSGGEMVAGSIPTVIYDGTAFRIAGIVAVPASVRNWFGQCYLTVSGGNLVLRPDTGPGILIDRVYRDLPGGGITLSAAGNANSTTYFIYAYWTGGAVALERSTTVPVQDATTLQMLKTGDASRSYVGLARSSAAGAWQAAPLVASHYNKRPRIASAQMNSGNSYGGTPYVAIAATQIEFVCDDGFVQCLGQGSVAAGTPIPISSEAGHIAMGIDSATTPAGQAPRIHGDRMMGASFFGVSNTLSRGHHYSVVIVNAVAGNPLFYDNLENITLTNG